MKHKISKLLAQIFLFSSKAFIKTGRIIGEASHKMFGEVIQNLGIDESTKYNMLGTDSEIYYLDRYWSVLDKYIKTAIVDAKILDLGCSQGRFTHRLAIENPDKKIIGVDLSQRAINYAIENSPTDSSNLEYKVRTIKESLAEQADHSVDIIIMTEVTVFYPEWIGDISEIQRCLKPGGVFITTFRSRYYNLLHCIANNNWESIDEILNKDEGFLFGNPTKFQWKDKSQISKIIEEELGFTLNEIYGIGSCSGIEGDPFSRLCMPENLSVEQKILLGDAEDKMGKMLPDASRYILTVATKPSIN